MTKVTIDPGICGFPIIAYQISHIHVFSSMTDLKPFSNWIAILSPRSLLPGRPYCAIPTGPLMRWAFYKIYNIY